MDFSALRVRNTLTILWVALAVVTFSFDSGMSEQTRIRDFARPKEIPFPPDNPYSAEKARLGKSLFFDPILSGSGTRSCGSCHNPSLSWADGLARGLGESLVPMPLRSPTLLNVAWTPKLGWDGHFRDLEGVAFGPITNTNIMNMTTEALIARLSGIQGYRAAFEAAYGPGEITKRKIEMALATFERTIVSGRAPFDAWVGGDERAIGESAKRGFDLFVGKANCSVCHTGWAFTDSSFHDIVAAQGDDIGRGRLFPTSKTLRYAFKTPTLRDVDRRAPYMHDGSFATLEDVIDLYDRGGVDRPSRSEEIKPLHLTAQEKSDLVAFLHTLTAPTNAVAVALPR